MTKRKGIVSDSTLPIKPLLDVRVSIPEGYTAGTNDTGYLDFALHPVTLAEVQRAGLFMLTQMAEAMGAHAALRELRAKYERECVEHGLTHKELTSLQSYCLEVEVERDQFRDSWREANELVVQLRAEIDMLRQAAAYDKDYIKTLETQAEKIV